MQTFVNSQIPEGLTFDDVLLIPACQYGFHDRYKAPDSYSVGCHGYGD